MRQTYCKCVLITCVEHVLEYYCRVKQCVYIYLATQWRTNTKIEIMNLSHLTLMERQIQMYLQNVFNQCVKQYICLLITSKY